jgi:hypothetical protein
LLRAEAESNKNKKSLSGNPDLEFLREEFVEVKVIPIFGVGFKAHSEKWD